MDEQALWDGLDQEAYQILAVAKQEYASPTDRLENFHILGQLLEMPARRVLLVYLMKHVTALMKGVSIREPMRGRIIDAMNYLRLLALMDALEGPHETGNTGRPYLPAVSNRQVPAVPSPVGLEQALD